MNDIYYEPSGNGFIYGLFASDEPERIVYIGRTIHEPIVRLRSHLGRKKGKFNRALARWIEATQANGSRVGMRIIEECPLSSLSERERHWIQHLKPSTRLLNVDGVSPKQFWHQNPPANRANTGYCNSVHASY